MISILGCGWLGIPLAKHFIDKGHIVYGSTTTPNKIQLLKDLKIVPFLIQLSDLNNNKEIETFLSSEILIINIPPGRDPINSKNYSDYLKAFHQHIKRSSIKKLIFISSTSVYKENNGFVNENSEIKNENKAQTLFAAEEIFRENKDLKTTIIRLAGLIGPERHPGRFFSGKKDIPNGLAPVNLIYLDDCIRIITAVIEKNYWNKTINAVAEEHPTKKEFYTQATLEFNGIKPVFIEEKMEWKIVKSDLLNNDLNIQATLNKNINSNY
jgi:nucleoside-diphosphate-sugar epimerase